MIRCADSVAWVPSGGTVTLFDSRDGSYHALNESASEIWSAISEGGQPDEISAAIARARQIDQAMVRDHVEAFVAAALDKGLLVAEA